MNGNGKPEWEDVTILNPIKWGFGALISILFIFMLLFGFPILAILPIILFNNSIITTLLMKTIMNGKQISSFTIIKETLKHYKLSIVTIISLFVVLFAFSNLGVVSGFFSLLVLSLIYWGIISIDVFNPIKENNLTKLVSYNQAIKKCETINKNSDKHGFLYNMMFGQKGGNLIKQLKKINKTI